MIHPSTASKKFFPICSGASGKFVWDTQGRTYLDFTGANNTVILGYKQFDFSCPPNLPGVSQIELSVTKQLYNYTGRKHWRFFKTGSDAVSCAIRLARHLLGNDPKTKVYFYGYHGALNEYAYLLNKNGIPFQNVVMIDPRIVTLTRLVTPSILVYESRYKDFARKSRVDFKICDHLKSGVLGLFEETADIDLYGKSLGNGYPIAAMTGEAKYIESINEIYFSSTFACETNGIEAILNTLMLFIPKKKEYLALLDYARIKLPPWKRLDGEMIQKFWAEKNIFFNGMWQIMLCHSKEDIDLLSKAISECR